MENQQHKWLTISGVGKGHASKGWYENLSGQYKCYYCTKLKTLTKMDNLS